MACLSGRSAVDRDVQRSMTASGTPASSGVIDVHTHAIPPQLPQFGRRYAGSWPELVETGPCTADILLGGAHFRSVTDQCWNSTRRLQDMGQDNVARQVISPIPITFSYDLDVNGVVELSRAQNEWIAGVARDYPAQFTGLGSVPLQDPRRAAEMVSEVMFDLALAGIEIGSNVQGRNLDDPALDDFFAACAETGALVFIHPWQVLGASRLQSWGLAHSIGMTAETATAAASLILGGVLDRHPTLRVLLAHGGGAFLAMLPRIDRIWECVPDFAGQSGRPSLYVDRFYYDSLLFDPGAVAALIARVGADHVVVGTDYPFVVAERPAGAAVYAAKLPESVTAAVTSTTARTMLRLK
jgi:aminocarboxymuconate-semialdehyde decarboxylase